MASFIKNRATNFRSRPHCGLPPDGASAKPVRLSNPSARLAPARSIRATRPSRARSPNSRNLPVSRPLAQFAQPARLAPAQPVRPSRARPPRSLPDARPRAHPPVRIARAPKFASCRLANIRMDVGRITWYYTVM